jgi:ribonuclease E
MSKIMLINVTHAEESRVAIVADGTLVSFEIESFSREHLKGNIYKATVHRVQPGLEAAFVDIGADRDAFLPLDEICFRHLAAPPPRNGSGDGERRRPRIQDVLKPGEEILVQIVKEQFANKPPTLSTFYSLPGRYLVLLPGSDDAGISRRIEGADRARIRELIENLHPPEGFGIIVRTVAGFDPEANDLQRDLTYLLRLWESIQQAANSKRAPALVYREHDLVLRNIRDYLTPDIDEIHVDNEDVFERARDFLRDVMPEKEPALRLYQGDKPLFSYFNVESQIESIYKRRVPLKSGGHIVIDGTEALTAIDVNSGRSVRSGSQEETAFRTNLEAAAEIARQLRLRDQGGLIVIDFIDMRNPQHIGEVEKALRTAMFEDKARHEVGRISHFGLLEVSRQRLRPAAAATSYVTCPMCDGHALVRTTESAALVALRKVHNRIAQGDVSALRVGLPNDVAMYLLNQKRDDLAQLERRHDVRIQVTLRSDLMPHQSEIEVKPRVEGAAAEPQALRRGGVAVAAQEQAPVVPPTAAPPLTEAVASTPEPAAAIAPPPEGREGKRRRRRGRRRGRGKQAAAAIGEALSVLAGHVAGAAPVPEAGEVTPVTGADSLPPPSETVDLGIAEEERVPPPASDPPSAEPESSEPTALPSEATSTDAGADTAAPSPSTRGKRAARQTRTAKAVEDASAKAGPKRSRASRPTPAKPKPRTQPKTPPKPRQASGRKKAGSAPSGKNESPVG